MIRNDSSPDLVLALLLRFFFFFLLLGILSRPCCRPRDLAVLLLGPPAVLKSGNQRAAGKTRVPRCVILPPLQPFHSLGSAALLAQGDLLELAQEDLASDDAVAGEVAGLVALDPQAGGPVQELDLVAGLVHALSSGPRPPHEALLQLALRQPAHQRAETPPAAAALP